MSKKLVSTALAATTLMWAVGVAVLPVANAQTATSVQSQIQALLAQIAQLQAQMGTTSSATMATPSYTFSKDLTLGSKGADVTALQQILINGGYLTGVTAPTGYFGALTQKALAAFQSAKGIAPAAGYFGPKTMAFVNSMSVGTTTTTTTTTTGTTTGGATVTTGVAAPASGVAVSLAASNPAAGSLISGDTGGAARVPVLAVNFTAGTSGGVTVSEVKFHKVGVLSDSSISGAYLTQNGKVLYQYNSLNQGVLDFSGMSLNVPAGQTVTLTLAIDVSGGLSAGNTTAFSMNSASDVSAFDASNNALTATGMFPVNGNIFTVTNVSNPSLAAVTVAGNSVGNQVTAGTQGNLVAAWNFTVNNSKVYLNGINFHVIGSASKGDIRNVKLMVNGTQVGATLPTVNQDGTAYFDASATPGVLNTGSNNVQVFADVMGSPSYNFQFEILNGYDVLALDSQYNVPVTVGNAAGATITMTGSPVSIQQGQITVTQDSNTPTGNIARGQSQITIAKFDIYAAGEAVKVKYLPIQLVFGGVNANGNVAAVTALNQLIQNVSMVDDAGGQVGTTINQPPLATATVTPGVGLTDASGVISGSGNLTYADSFGTSASPINYTIPANTTRVLSLKADVQSTANFQTVTGSILQGSNNLQGMISSQIGSTSGAQGSALSLAASSLAVGQNNALGTQKVASGVQGLEIGSYSLTASSAEGVNINNLSVTMGGSTNVASQAFQNLKVLVNGTQFGTTYGTLNDEGIYTFSGTAFNVPAGNSVNVNVYADTLSSATSSATDISPATYLSGLSGTGSVSNSAISLTGGSVRGQNLTFAGATTMTVAADSSQPSSGTLTMGSTGNTLAVYRFQETGNTENVKVTDLVVTDVASSSAASTLPAFNNVTLWNGSTLLGTAGSASSSPTLVSAGNNAVAATGSLTLQAGPATTSTTLYIGSVQVGVTNGQSSTTIATAIAAAVNGSAQGGFTVTATSVGGVVNFTQTAGNNTSFAVVDAKGGTDGVTATVATTVTLAGGSVAVPATYSNAYRYAFHFATPIAVPQANTTLVTLKGDIASYSSNGATDNSSHVFEIASSSDVTALGATSNLSTQVSGTALSNSQTVLRSTMTVAASSVTQTGKQPSQQIGSVTLTANNAGSVALAFLKLTFSGNGIAADNASSSGFIGTSSSTTSIVLKNSNSVDVHTANGAVVAVTPGASAAVVSWTFPTSTPLVISAGQSITLQVWGQTNLIPSQANVSQSVSAAIQGASDLTYYDGTDATGLAGHTVSLPTNVVPITVSSLSWGQGQ